MEPPPSSFVFPPVSTADEHGRVVTGGDLEPGTILQAYRSGLFPMRVRSGELTWFSPDPRAIVPVERLRVTRSLRRSVKRYRTTVDAAFSEVISACAERPPDAYVWITDEIRASYARLHELGWAHSVETWTIPNEGDSPELVGGLYGIAIGGAFFGESMFSRAPDASKVALVTLVEVMAGAGDRFIDVQWLTPHLASLGAVEVSREEYLGQLERALTLSLPDRFL